MEGRAAVRCRRNEWLSSRVVWYVSETWYRRVEKKHSQSGTQRQMKRKKATQAVHKEENVVKIEEKEENGGCRLCGGDETVL